MRNAQKHISVFFLLAFIFTFGVLELVAFRNIYKPSRSRKQSEFVINKQSESNGSFIYMDMEEEGTENESESGNAFSLTDFQCFISCVLSDGCFAPENFEINNFQNHPFYTDDIIVKIHNLRI